MLGAQVKRSGSRLVQFPREWSLEKRKKREKKRGKKGEECILYRRRKEREIVLFFLFFFFVKLFNLHTIAHLRVSARVANFARGPEKCAIIDLSKAWHRRYCISRIIRARSSALLHRNLLYRIFGVDSAPRH